MYWYFLVMKITHRAVNTLKLILKKFEICGAFKSYNRTHDWGLVHPVNIFEF